MTSLFTYDSWEDYSTFCSFHLDLVSFLCICMILQIGRSTKIRSKLSLKKKSAEHCFSVGHISVVALLLALNLVS